MGTFPHFIPAALLRKPLQETLSCSGNKYMEVVRI
jgi:hypothetical protein